MQSLVSVLTPCYNGAEYISRLLNSVYEQDYPNIEMIVVDDGSTDNTKSVINSYIDKFHKKGFSLSCISQPNGGQSSAINNGLKLVKGEYLVWPDADDFFISNQAISKMVHTFETATANTGIVRVESQTVSEDDFNKILQVNRFSDIEPTFDDVLFSKNGWVWTAGAYMTKMSIIDATIPNREIYVSKKAGQNYQIVLPIIYSHGCKTIHECLYAIVCRKLSHSHNVNTIDKQISIVLIYKETMLKTIDNMVKINHHRREFIKKEITDYINNRLISICIFKRTKLNKLLKTLDDHNYKELPFSYKLLVRVSNNSFMYYLIKTSIKLKIKICQ